MTTHDPTLRTRDRRQLVLLLAIDLVLLLWLIVWKFVPPSTAPFTWDSLNLIPFHNANGFSVAPSEIAINVLLFVPIGVLLRLLGARRSSVGALLLIFGWSLLCEVLQLALGVGAADTTDLITNSAGGLLGLLCLPNAWTSGRPRRLLLVFAWAGSIATLVGGLAIAVAAFPAWLQYVQHA